MRHALIALLGLLLSACGAVPKPFEHHPGSRYPVVEAGKVELTIAPPAKMPDELGMRVAAALAVELQAYGILAVVQPNDAPMKLGGVMTTRESEAAIEIEVAWYVDRGGQTEGPAISKTRTQQQDYAGASDRLVSRIAQQAAPRIATLMGKPPTFTPSSPGQVAAGVSLPMAAPVDPLTTTPVAASALPGQKPTSTPGPPSGTPPSQLKIMVAPVTGAPSDGNRQLFSGMRRALGSNKIVVIDRPGADTFTVVGNVQLTELDEKTGRLVIKWVLKDPAGKEVGELEQANNVPMAAARGTWAGFGDVVGTAAAEGILELLDKALRAR